MPIDELKNASGRILLEVPVDDFVFLFSFQHRGEGQDSKRQSAIAWPRGARMIEDDHAPTRAS